MRVEIMKWQVTRTARGKTTVVAEGDRAKMANRLKQLRASSKNGVSGQGGKKYPVTFDLVPVEEAKS
jgi:hypothetical protein